MMSTLLALSTAASDIKAARNIENSVGAITQPCFTPVLMLNDPDCSPSYSTHPFMSSYSCRVMLTNVGGHPSRARHAHMASLFTESYAWVRSINAKRCERPELHFCLCLCMCVGASVCLCVCARACMFPYARVIVYVYACVSVCSHLCVCGHVCVVLKPTYHRFQFELYKGR